jgi:putative ABC transport system substrate-binding protein
VNLNITSNIPANRTNALREKASFVRAGDDDPFCLGREPRHFAHGTLIALARCKVARIGFLGAASASAYARQVEGFRSGLRDLSYIEGSNIVIVYRWAEGKYERIPELAASLVRSNVDLIVTHGTPGTLAARRATTTVPIVVASIGDPIATGVIASVARPGGNITGLSWFGPQLEAKRSSCSKT